MRGRQRVTCRLRKRAVRIFGCPSQPHHNLDKIYSMYHEYMTYIIETRFQCKSI